MPQAEEMSYAEAVELARVLAEPGAGMRIFAEAAQLEHRARLASRLIVALLRGTHSSDVFRLPPEVQP